MSHFHSTPTVWNRMSAIVRQRCPRCCRGSIFSGLFTMNEPCPKCGLIFQREEGYFLGAMYVSFVLGTFLVAAGFFFLQWVMPHWSEFTVLGVVILIYFLLVPMVFRYSRTLWIHYDRWSSPGDVSAGAYEKAKAAELADQTANKEI